MPGRYKNPNYHNEWYAKNKERLLADDKRREAKKIADRKYYLKNKQRLCEYAKKYTKKNKEKVKRKKQEYYLKNREKFNALRKQLRATPEYKQYVKEYRKKNKAKINEQQKVTSAKHIQKIVNAITDSYIVGQLLLSPLNTLSRKELYENKELIELKRGQILLFRLKKKINELKK